VNYGPLMSALEDASNSAAESQEIEICRARVVELAAEILAAAGQDVRGGLDAWRTAYDARGCWMRSGFDSGQFIDFLNHSASNCATIVHDFLAAKTVDSYRAMPGRLAEILGVPDMMYVNALVSNAFAGALAPDVKADGGGTMDADTLNLALDLFVNHDPLVLLRLIADRGVAPAVEALKAITSGWREVLSFAHELTSDDCLSQSQADARAAIARFLTECI
jgi:hypothetical protein